MKDKSNLQVMKGTIIINNLITTLMLNLQLFNQLRITLALLILKVNIQNKHPRKNRKLKKTLMNHQLTKGTNSPMPLSFPTVTLRKRNLQTKHKYM